MNFIIRKDTGYLVSCVKEVPSNPRGIVIAVHGFSSSRECATYRLLKKKLPEAGYGMIGIELPGHGTAESSREPLRVEGALGSIAAAEEYAAENYPEIPISYFASSFGAYLTGIFISTRKHRGRKAFFRSAAVNMPDLFSPDYSSALFLEKMEEMDEKGYMEVNVEENRPVRILPEMLRDFQEYNLFSLFDPDCHGSTKVFMVHGEKDTVIDPEKAKQFSRLFRIPLTVFPDEGHSLSDHPKTAEKVADLAISFFDGI